MKKVLVVCTTDSMIWNFLVPHIEYLKSKGIEVECACSRTGFYFDELVSMGLMLHEIPFERSPFKLKNISGFFKLRKLIKDNKYDLIQCHEPVGGAMGRLAGKSFNKKVMYFAHGFHFFKGAKKSSIIYHIIEYLFSYLTDDLITINREDYEASLKMHAKTNHLIHGIGIDTSKFIKATNKEYISKELKLPEENYYLLSVGELIPRKNHISVIRSLPLLPGNVHYLIVGDGELKETLIKEAKSLNLENRVHFLGFRKDIPSICNAVDVFILPSYQEGLSVALMEAMAIGLPVVASDIRGNRDLIDDGKGGYLVPIEDYKEYALKIKFILDNPQESKKLGEYNRNKISLYDIKHVQEEIAQILK